MTNTKTQRLLNALQNGHEVSASTAMNKFGFSSTGSVRKAISELRYDGYAIYANEGQVTKYRIGTPTRSLIAAGYRRLGA